MEVGERCWGRGGTFWKREENRKSNCKPHSLFFSQHFSSLPEVKIYQIPFISFPFEETKVPVYPHPPSTPTPLGRLC